MNFEQSLLNSDTVKSCKKIAVQYLFIFLAYNINSQSKSFNVNFLSYGKLLSVEVV